MLNFICKQINRRTKKTLSIHCNIAKKENIPIHPPPVTNKGFKRVVLAAVVGEEVEEEPECET